MQFTAECWIRTYRLESDWLGAFGWQARAVFSALSVKFDAAGDIPLGPSGIDFLVGLTGIPRDVLDPELATLVTAGVFEWRETAQGQVLHDPRFLDRQADRARRVRVATCSTTSDGQGTSKSYQGSTASKPAMTPAERAKAYRQRKQLEAVTGVTNTVTKRHVTRHAPNVTENVTISSSEMEDFGEIAHVVADRHVTSRDKERNKERFNPPRDPLPERDAAPGDGAQKPTQETPPSLAETERSQTAPEIQPGTIPPTSTWVAPGSGGGKDELSGASTTLGAIEAWEAQEGPVLAPQSGGRKPGQRPVEVRRLEQPAFVQTYENAVLRAKKAKGEDARYALPRRAVFTLDDALDTYGPKPMQGDRQAWLDRAVTLFVTHSVGVSYQSCDPGAFLAWLNAGELARFDASEAAERRRRERSSEVVREGAERRKALTETEKLQALIARNRELADAQERNQFFIPGSMPAELRAAADEAEKRLNELNQAEVAHA